MMYGHRANELLGYLPDARLLILNADDFGMYPAITGAIARTLTDGVVRSTTLMTPCPDASNAMEWLRAHPDQAFGVHLTIIRDLEHYTYAPVSPPDRVPSLVDAAGTLLTDDQQDILMAQADVSEVEREFRAQIETVLNAGLRPTHLDWHCLANGGRRDIFDLTCALANEYRLAVRVAHAPINAEIQQRGLPATDYELVDSFRIPTQNKADHYARMLRELPAGLSEWAVHPGSDAAAAQAIDDGWPVRAADAAFLLSPEARTIIEQEGIILLDYRPIQDAWNAR